MRQSDPNGNFARGKEIVRVEGKFLRETEKANLVEFPIRCGFKSCWLPKSMFSEPLEIVDSQSGECVCLLQRWLAEKNSLDYAELDAEEEEAPKSDVYLEPDYDDEIPF